MAAPTPSEDTGVAAKPLDQSPSKTGLNLEFRKQLEELASSANDIFTQDNIGNIYITRRGLDSSLSSIALSFPLDTPSPHISFFGALHTYMQLQETKTKSDVTLLGFSSPADSTIGHDVWEGEVPVSEAYEQYPELRAFAANEDASTFSLSAMLEVIEAEDAPLVARGSPLLVDEAKATDGREVGIEEGGPVSSRSPVVSIYGSGAIDVGKATVAGYSAHIGKSFEKSA